MAANDQVLLDTLFNQRKALMTGLSDDGECFEIFTFEQILKQYDLSYDELVAGRIGDGGDGGIDGFYTFVGGELVDEDTSLDIFRRGVQINVYIIQSKRTASFGEIPVERVTSTVLDLFNLTMNEAELEQHYNAGLVKRAMLFRSTLIELQNRHPTLTINFAYATRGDANEIHVNVRHKAEIFKEKVSGQFHGATVRAIFLGARELLDLARQENSYTLQLQFLENYIARGTDNYIILASLNDYYDFVTDEQENLRRYIFEANVRDYEGAVEVNQDIRFTLEANDALDFWWLNNGITVIASRASIAGKTITLDDVQIVNGLQTTTTIHGFMNSTGGRSSPVAGKAILVRIIVTTDGETRDRIIKATNFQTRVTAASLRATDKLQRDIEEFFQHKGWFYDRRKNYYKNLGKPADRIIGITYLAQSIMAVVLQQPDNSRARPSSIIKSQESYEKVFAPTIPLEVYFYCATTMRTIDRVSKGMAALPASAVNIDKSNFRFHVATLLAIRSLGKISYCAEDIKNLADKEVPPEIFDETVNQLLDLLDQYCTEKSTHAFDVIAKSRDFVAFMIEKALPSRKWKPRVK